MIHRCFHHMWSSQYDSTGFPKPNVTKYTKSIYQKVYIYIYITRLKTIKSNKISKLLSSFFFFFLFLFFFPLAVPTCQTHWLPVFWRELDCSAPSLILTSRRWTRMAPLFPFVLNREKKSDYRQASNVLFQICCNLSLFSSPSRWLTMAIYVQLEQIVKGRNSWRFT